MITFLD